MREDIILIDGLYFDMLIVPSYYSDLTLNTVHNILQFIAIRTIFPKEKDLFTILYISS